MGVISSLGPAPGQPTVDAARCLRCGRCAAICPTEVLLPDSVAITVDNSINFGCIACGQCMTVCPNGSITVTGRDLSPADLTDLPSREERATPPQLAALMRSRRSIRRFSDREIHRAIIERIVEAAACAPMAIPPSEVGITVVNGRAKVAELSRDVAKGYAGLLKFMDNGAARLLGRVLMKRTTYDRFDSFIIPLARVIVDGDRQGKDYVLYHAPAALIFHVSPYTDTADADIACTYAMLAAEAEGLGSCMIGCTAPILARSADLKQKYRIPERHTPALVLILGYHDGAHKKGIKRRFRTVEYM